MSVWVGCCFNGGFQVFIRDVNEFGAGRLIENPRLLSSSSNCCGKHAVRRDSNWKPPSGNTIGKLILRGARAIVCIDEALFM